MTKEQKLLLELAKALSLLLRDFDKKVEFEPMKSHQLAADALDYRASDLLNGTNFADDLIAQNSHRWTK
jgi:hypothetical protein